MERFLEYFEPVRYDLDLLVDRVGRRLEGVARVTGKVVGEVVKLHAVGLKLNKVLVGGTSVKYEYSGGVLSFDVEGFVGREIEIEVGYSLEITESMQGVYISRYQCNGKEETMVATQFESHYARECFPCVDEPAAKAVFGLTMRVADAGDEVVANMPMDFAREEYAGGEDQDERVGDRGRGEFLYKRVVFEDTPRMSTYLVAFVVGKFRKVEVRSEQGVAVTTYAGLHQSVEALRFAADFAVRCVDFYSNLFGVPYPLPKLDQVAVPDFEAGAMENWGLMTFREQALLCDEGSALDQKLYVATVVAHEISHMWFGDLVTMRWWDDLWLNESFASLMETYAVDKLMPELKPWDDFYVGTVVPALRRDCLPGVQPVKVDVANVEDIANLFDGAIVYAKGARLMLMLMRLMGEESFFSGLNKYFGKHAYGNTMADDLWESLTPFAEFDVKEFMTPWLVQPGYPVISSGGGQRRFLIGGDVMEGGGAGTGGGVVRNYVYPVSGVRDDLSGHYVLNLSSVDFEAALADFEGKNKEQKLRLLLDRGLLAKTPAVASVSLFQLIEKFRGEQDYVIWDAVGMLVGDLKVFLDYESGEERKFKGFVGNLAREAYGRLGVMAVEGEEDGAVRLRPIVMGLMCYAEDRGFIEEVKRVYGGAKVEEMDANVRSVVLTVLLREDEGLGRGYFETYLTTADPELKADLMVALTGTRRVEIAEDYLVRLKDGTIKTQDRLHFFARLARNSAVRVVVLDWMYENWEWLARSEGDKTIADYPRLVAGLVRAEIEAEQYRKFFGARAGEAILARNVDVGLAEIEARLGLIAADGPAVWDFLKGL